MTKHKIIQQIKDVLPTKKQWVRHSKYSSMSVEEKEIYLTSN